MHQTCNKATEAADGSHKCGEKQTTINNNKNSNFKMKVKMTDAC